MLLAPRKPRYSSKLCLCICIWRLHCGPSGFGFIYMVGIVALACAAWPGIFFFFLSFCLQHITSRMRRRFVASRQSADDPRRSQPPVPIPFLSDNLWMSFENSALSCAWWKQEEKILLIRSVHPDQMRKQTCKQRKRNLVCVYVCIWEFSAAMFKN